MRQGFRRGMGSLLAACLLASCAPRQEAAETGPPSLPLAMLRSRVESNAQAVAAFVTADPGWRMWLNAFASSSAAADMLSDQSMQNVQTLALSQAISDARDRYRAATAFYLRPVLVKSSCLDLPEETTGAVRLPSALTLRYRLLSKAWITFPNGSRCQQATGYVSEVDSPGGLSIATVADLDSVQWDHNFALSLTWNSPFEQIAQDDSLSLMRLMILSRR